MVFNGLNGVFFLLHIKDFDEVKTEFKRLKRSFLKAWCQCISARIK
jgi:hypothetical protein